MALGFTTVQGVYRGSGLYVLENGIGFDVKRGNRKGIQMERKRLSEITNKKLLVNLI